MTEMVPPAAGHTVSHSAGLSKHVQDVDVLGTDTLTKIIVRFEGLLELRIPFVLTVADPIVRRDVSNGRLRAETEP